MRERRRGRGGEGRGEGGRETDIIGVMAITCNVISWSQVTVVE